MTRIACRIVCLRYYARLLVYIAEDRSVLREGLLACVLEHAAHVLCSALAITPCDVKDILPHPYAICAIWLLGTMLPLAFLTILGDASDVAFGATAASMMPTIELPQLPSVAFST